jgi:hypothetical protein
MIDVKIDNFHYKRMCTIEGSIKNVSKAEALISAKLRQSIENYLQSMSVSNNTTMTFEKDIQPFKFRYKLSVQQL